MTHGEEASKEVAALHRELEGLRRTAGDLLVPQTRLLRDAPGAPPAQSAAATFILIKRNSGAAEGNWSSRRRASTERTVGTPHDHAGEGRIHRYDLSFDGREIVFAWQKNRREPFQIYRMHVDGSGLRQLTSGPPHNFDPCWLPDGGIAFISTRDRQSALRFWSQAGLLYRMDGDGGRLRRLSHGVVHDLTPSVMHDGRIVYTRWEYVDKGVQPIQSLWTILPDGTRLAGYDGNRVLLPVAFFSCGRFRGPAPFCAR